MKEKINYGVVITALIGTLFGVGIVSGQESLQVYLCQNDSIFSKTLISILVLITMTYFILKTSYVKKPKSFENIIFHNKLLKILLQLFFVTTSLIGLTLMFAGAGALFESLFGWHTIIGSIIIACIVGSLGLSGSQSIIKLFKYIVPFLIVVAIITSLISLLVTQDNSIITNPLTKQCMFTNQYLSSAIYAFYFIVLLIPVLVPIGKQFNNSKGIFKSSVLASIIFGLGILLITLAMSKNLNLIHTNDLPMLELAKSINPLLGIIYASALIGGVIVCPSAILFGMINLFETKDNKYLSNRSIVVVFLCLTALIFSRVGFAKILSLIVPVVGIIGLILSIIIVYKYLRKQDV